MTDRDRLIKLLLQSDPIKERDLDDDWGDGELEEIADYLIANGVIVPPCKVGDKAWFVLELDDKWLVCEETVVDFSTKGFYYSEFLDGTGAQILVPYEEIGKTVFFTKEEAEEKVKGLNKNA